MTWFKVDDELHDHRKARVAGKAAMGVWVLAGSWCGEQGNDGFVPRSVLPRWGSTADASRLVKAGFWVEAEQDDEEGWRFHDWSRYQPSARDEQLKRAAQSEGAATGNHIRWHVKRGVFDLGCELCQQSRGAS